MPNQNHAQRVRERNLFYLLRIARRRVIAKGHHPGPWKIWADGKGAIASCTRCDMPFGCLTNPYPIETAVSGTATAYQCQNKPWWGSQRKEKSK